MSKLFHLAILAVAMSGVLASPAFAGGGSTKANPELTVENDTEHDVYVVVNPTNDFQTRVFNRIVNGDSPTFSDAFTALGGQIIEAEDEESYDVRKGNVQILVADADAVDAIANNNQLTLQQRRDQIAAAFGSATTIDVQGDTTVEVSDLLQ